MSNNVITVRTNCLSYTTGIRTESLENLAPEKCHKKGISTTLSISYLAFLKEHYFTINKETNSCGKKKQKK